MFGPFPLQWQKLHSDWLKHNKECVGHVTGKPKAQREPRFHPQELVSLCCS